MGKYMKKPKLTTDMIDSSSSSSSLGVRTRAKTLALQKLHPSAGTDQSAYLELRSRKLEKPVFRRVITDQNPNPNSVEAHGGAEDEETEEGWCFGENSNLDFDARQRRTRESTPCDSIKDFNVMSTPGSSTRPRDLEASNQIASNIIARSMPLAREIEEFFASHEQEQHRRFADKYNFDFANEKPLEGCYEWAKVESH